MASYNELNALIDAYINRNGVQAITGQILNGVLKAMVEQLGRGYTIMGAAIPTTDPGTPDGPECYFASETGTYTDFDGLQIVPGELALLCYTPSDGWTKETIYEGFQTVQATIDGNVGTPSVGVSYANGVLSFDFHNMKGNPGQNGQDGQDGDPAGFGTIGADITGGVGTPGVTVESSGPATAKNLQFHFTNLKGETGVTSVVATVDNTTGTPTCTASLSGGVLTLAFTGLKGAQGDTGSSVDYPFTIVNNLTTDDATQALSAAQGVVLDGKVSQLEAEVSDVIHGKKTYQKALIVASGNQQIALDEFNFGKKIIARIVSNTATCASVEVGVRINGSSSAYYPLSQDWLTVEKTSDIDRLYFYAADTTVAGDIVVEVAYADAIPLFINESYTVDSVPTENSDNLVKSGGVYSAIKVVGDKVQDLDEEINGIPGGPLSFTENTGGYYNTSGQFVQHSGKYAEIDLSRYAGQTLTLAITNASGSSTRATCFVVNGAVVSYVLENDANFDRTWVIPENAVLRESHTAESTITVSVSGETPALLTDKFVFPKGFAWPDNPLVGHLSAKRDGDIVSDLDLSTFKVQGGVTYYVSPSGNDSNSGLDAEHPLSNIRVAIEKADVGTVILASGLYNIYRLPSGSTAFTKSVNLVAASGATPIIAPYRSGGGWSKQSDYNYVYAQGYGNSLGIVNLAKLDANGDYTPYTKVASIDEVEATENSWFTDSSKTYIHATAAVPDNTILNLENSFPIWADYSGNETLYLEGLTVIGGNGASCRVRNVGTGRPLFVARNCKFGYPKEGNALHLLSIDSICENCVCCYARADGFNYHKDTGNTALPRSIELGCIGRSNGFKGFYPDGTANTDNGSTSHDGGVAIRINGQYYDNIGPNVADAGDGQQSLNLGCVAHHSKAESTQACGFQMNGNGAVMFCDTCAAFSNPYNFRAEAGTKLKMRNCSGEPTNAEGGEIWAY